MTCREFGERLDRHVAGDVAGLDRLRAGDVAGRDQSRAGDDDARLMTHAAGCRRCARLLRSIRAWCDPAVRANTVGDGGRRADGRLRAALARAGRPAIRFGSLTTPIGRVFVGTSDRGLFDVTLDAPSEAGYLARLAPRVCDATLDPLAVRTVLDELRAYFAGARARFTVPIDLSGVTDFTAQVLRETGRIPFGGVRSYGEIAHQIGSPGASRAVGGALGRNPVPIVIPCHRVIARGGGIGGFTGGLPAKRALLRIEGHGVSGRSVGERW